MEIEQLPPPQWLIESTLVDESLAVLYGPPAAGKSFLAISIAMSIGSGRRWWDRPGGRGPVLYVAGEGSGGLGPRIRAWKRHSGHEGEAGCYFVTDAVQLAGGDGHEALLRALDARKVDPRLIVIDTMARCFVGRDENSAKDVGEFIASCDALRRRAGATVLVLHHTGKSGDLERGSSALRGAADTMMACRPISGTEGFTLSCDKQKEGEAFADLVFELHGVEIEPGLSSCVPTVADLLDLKVTGPSEKEILVLETLAGFGDGGATATQWEERAKEAGVSSRTFFRVVKQLVERGKVEKEPKKRGAHYRVLTA